MSELRYPLYDQLAHLKGMMLGPRYPLHCSESYLPFFIIGSGRCGSTLLRRILQASPELHIPPEIWVLGRAISLFRRNLGRPWPFLVRTVLAQFEFQPGFEVFGISLRPLANRLMDAPRERRSLALILDSFYRYHGEQSGQSFQCWGDKTPRNTHHMDRLIAVFPDARFIHALRDGVDVVYSVLVKDAGEVSLDYAARRWAARVSAARKFARRYPDSCHEVRYEALVNDPVATVERLCQFLGVRFDVSMIESLEHKRAMPDIDAYDHFENVFRPITATSVGKGRRELTEQQKSRLQGLIGPGLERLGYDPAV